MKVKLISISGHGTEASPYIGGTDKVIDKDIVLSKDEVLRGIILTAFDPDVDGSRRVSDDILPVITLSHINNLNARIFSVVDAIFPDKRQHDAVRDMLRDVTFQWYMGHLDSLTDTWRKQPDEAKNEVKE